MQQCDARRQVEVKGDRKAMCIIRMKEIPVQSIMS
jgi:hypothetical protein